MKNLSDFFYLINRTKWAMADRAQAYILVCPYTISVLVIVNTENYCIYTCFWHLLYNLGLCRLFSDIRSNNWIDDVG